MQNHTHAIHFLPLTRDAAYLEICWAEAERRGIRGVHFSHDLCHDATDLLNDPEHAAEARAWVADLQKRNLDIWVWTHEIHSVPADFLDENGRLRFDDTDWPGYLKEKYRRFLGEVLPGITGLVFTFAETPFEIYKEDKVVSALSPDARLKRLMAVLVEICAEHGVRVALRDFVYRPDEVEAMGQALRDLPPDVIVMSKAVPHDWEPFYPPNPLLGKVGDREQWVEFDLGYEYEGQLMLPYANLEQHHTWLLAAGAAGIHQVCLRLDRFDGDCGQSALSTPWGKLMLDAFEAWDREPEMSCEALWQRWEAGQFPGAAKVLQGFTTALQNLAFPLENWLMDHSILPSFAYAKSHLYGGNAARLGEWTGDPAQLETLAAFNTLPEGFRARLEQEAAEGLTEFERAEKILQAHLCDDHPDAALWMDGVQQMDSMLRLLASYRDVFFRIRELQHHPGDHAAVEKSMKNFRALTEAEAPKWINRRFTGKRFPVIMNQRSKLPPEAQMENPFHSVLISLEKELSQLPG